MDEQPTNNSSSDLSGKTLGQYELGEVLGQGGMATVYLAHQTSIGRTVAIKVMPSYFMGEPNFLQRFEREVKVIANLAHPRILPVIDYGQIDGRPYIVMAYIPGGTLSERIKQGPLPLEDTSRIITQIAEGLDHAHNKGVIHRDFKPSNVLLDEAGNAYLSDFGIAKISESTVQLTGSGVVGTPAYMAPEMAETSTVTPAVDIYAVGITLYQMLTGRYPYQGETPIRVMMAHAQDPIPDVRQARPDLPEGVAQVVRKAMAKRPEDRYATAGALAADLRAAIHGQPVAAASFTPSAQPAPSRPASAVQAPQPAPTSPTPMDSPTPMMPMTPPPPAKKGLFSSPLVVIGLVVAGLAVCVCGGIFIVGAMNGGGGATATTEAPVANLVIHNNSGEAICKVLVATSDETGPGIEKLDNGITIGPDDTYTVSGLAIGTYNFTARNCDNVVISDNIGVNLAAGDYNWDVGPRAVSTSGVDTASLKIINQTGEEICTLYVSPAGDSDWGDNQLTEGQTIQDQSEYTLDNIPLGTYDLRAETCGSGNYAEHLDAELDGELSWTLSPQN